MLEHQKVILFIGKTCILSSGTLKNAVDEVFCTPIKIEINGLITISNNYILGNIIKIIESKPALKCYWEHISDNPKSLLDLANKNKPILQSMEQGSLILKSSITSIFNPKNEPCFAYNILEQNLKILGVI